MTSSKGDLGVEKETKTNVGEVEDRCRKARCRKGTRTTMHQTWIAVVDPKGKLTAQINTIVRVLKGEQVRDSSYSKLSSALLIALA